MRELVMLEMKKVKMQVIIKRGLITSGLLLGYLILYGIFLRQASKLNGQFLNQVMAYNKIVFTVFIAVLINKMFSEEIFSRSLSILFTYPISRSKLLLAKLVLILLIGFPFMFGSMVVDLLVLSLLNAGFHFVEGSVGIGLLISCLLAALIQSVLAVLTAFIPLYVDVKYASAQYTLIVSGAIAIFLYTYVGSHVWGIELILFILTAALGCFAAKKAICYVVEKDVM